MVIHFMGTGTSQGVPMIGCDCAVCVSHDPRNRRFRTHVHVEMGGLNIQVDVAPEFRLRALEMRIPKVDLVLLTHGHADHILGFDDLRQYCELRNGEAISVYSTDEGLGRLGEIFPYAMRERAIVKGYPAFRANRMPEVLDLGNAGRIYSTLQKHGNIETLGFVFEEGETGKRLAYFTDCGSVSDEAVELASGADIVVLDGLRPYDHPSHMSIGQATEAALRIGGKRSFLIHMTHHVDHAATEAALPDRVRLASDRLVLEA